VHGHERYHGLGCQSLFSFSHIKDFGFGYDDPGPFPDDTGAAYKGVAMGGSQEINLELDSQDLEILGHNGEGRVAGRVIGHGGHDPGMDKAVLLPVMLLNSDL